LRCASKSVRGVWMGQMYLTWPAVGGGGAIRVATHPHTSPSAVRGGRGQRRHGMRGAGQLHRGGAWEPAGSPAGSSARQAGSACMPRAAAHRRWSGT
jgi:hypothetical protein